MRDPDLLQSQAFDIAIVGGGIHGAWLALRAAAAGLRIALVDKNDFGSATSANSLKILHGGLRYLQHLDLARMRSSIRARRAFGSFAPHLVAPLACVMPLSSVGMRSPWVLGPALLANDVISWDRNHDAPAGYRLPRGRLVGRDASARYLAPLAGTSATSAAVWWDGVALDAARLTLEPLFEAVRRGAVVANRVEAQALMLSGKQVNGLIAVDRVSGRTLEIRSSVVVDATGPWAGQLSAAAQLPTSFLPPGWIGGLNVVLRRSLGIEAAVALAAVSRAAEESGFVRRQNRELFFVPWRGVTMVGTDYHRIADRLTEGASPPASAVLSFIEEVARVAPRANISAADIALVHWGLQPLDAPDAALPRKTPIVAAGNNETGADGLVVVIGEKLTSAPMLSRTVLLRAIRELRDERRPAPVAALPIRTRESDDGELPDAKSLGDARPRLVARYGERWKEVARQSAGDSRLLARIHPTSEVRCVEIIYALRHEMAMTLDDLVLRRLGIGDLGHPGIDVLRRCAAVMAAHSPEAATDMDAAIVRLDAWFVAHATIQPDQPGELR